MFPLRYISLDRGQTDSTIEPLTGNPQQIQMNDAAGDGLAAIRLFTPCSDDKCDVGEWPERVRCKSCSLSAHLAEFG